MQKISQFDRQCLDLAIEIAKETFELGNYPVGAVLAFNNQVIGQAGNEINKRKSFVNHAENSLIMKHGRALAKVRKDKETTVSLYSTLEPCIQCLGAAVTNHVDRILFIQCDPNGGACNTRHDNIGVWYKEFWPEIIHTAVSDESRQLMTRFFRKEIAQGNTEWPQRMLKLLKSPR